jgi:hypothetical protein
MYPAPAKTKIVLALLSGVVVCESGVAHVSR